MQELCGVSSCCAAAVACIQSMQAICDLRGFRREECTRPRGQKNAPRIFALLFFSKIFCDDDFLKMISKEDNL
jgi:hypothetical protein